MFTLPALTPVTTPTLLTVATPTSELTHALLVAAVPLPVNVTVSSTHTLVDPLTVGNGLTVTVMSSVATHPFASVPVTVYVAVAVGMNDVHWLHRCPIHNS